MLQFYLPEGPEIKNIVMMGMGEPLANYRNTLKAIRIITSDYGLGFSTRKITLSTSGITPMIEQLGRDLCINLAISLNAPTDSIRSELMPVNRKYPLDRLLQACRNYPMPGRRMLTFEYILIDGVNSSPAHAEMLCRLLKGIRCKLNLIRFNEFPDCPFKTPSEETVLSFQQILVKHHYTTIIRASRGETSCRLRPIERQALRRNSKKRSTQKMPYSTLQLQRIEFIPHAFPGISFFWQIIR